MFNEYKIRIQEHRYSDFKDLYITLVDTNDELRNNEVKKQYENKTKQLEEKYHATYFQINLLDDNKEFITTIL